MTYLLMCFPSSKDPSAVVDCLTSSGILFKVHSSFEGLAPFAKNCSTFPESGGQEPIPWEGHIPGYPPLFHNEEKTFILMYFPPTSDPSTVVDCLRDSKILFKLDSTYEGLASFAKMCSIKVEIKDEEIDYSEGGDAAAIGNEQITREVKEEIEEESGLVDDSNGQGGVETNEEAGRRRSVRHVNKKAKYSMEISDEESSEESQEEGSDDDEEWTQKPRRKFASRSGEEKEKREDGAGLTKPHPCDTSLNEDEEEQDGEGTHQTTDDDDTEKQKDMRKVCPVGGCSEKSSSEEDLKKHMLMHPKPMSCGVCKRLWPSPAALRQHYRIHSGDKPFKCPTCERKFTQAGDLKVHIRQHTGEKPFGCDICGKKFTHHSSLKHHKTTPTGEKDFACSLCDYRCACSGHLTKHMRTHSKEKPFKCSDCDKCFSRKDHMDIHKATVHLGLKKYSCKECVYKTARRAGLT